MAASIMDLDNGFFKALHEVIIETEKALCDVSRIDPHYIRRMVTVMTSWQEVVQAAVSHMEGIDTTTYLEHREDMWRATHKYVKEVIQAHEEHNATHKEEQKKRIEAIKADDFEDPVVCLLHITCKVACTQAEKAVDAFLSSIKSTLHKHIPANAQGPLIANTLSTAFQFQMSMCHMIGEECVRPMWVKHSDWCGFAGIIQAIVEMFPKNCALTFPPLRCQCPLSHSPAPSGPPHLMKMMTMMMTCWALIDFAASTPAHLHPLLVGTQALAVLAVLFPSHPSPCLMEVPFIWQVTRRRCPAVQLVRPQVTKERVVEVCLMRSLTWRLRPMPTRSQLKTLRTNSILTLRRSRY